MRTRDTCLCVCPASTLLVVTDSAIYSLNSMVHMAVL